MSETKTDEQKACRCLFADMILAQIHHRSALKEVWRWNEMLKDDTGGYRGTGDEDAQDDERKARDAYRKAFDAYFSRRLRIDLPPQDYVCDVTTSSDEGATP